MGTLKQNIHWILLIATILLLLGCFNLPMGYYTFMRIVACIVAVLIIMRLLVIKSNRKNYHI